jgi:hypothetical protein
MSGVAGALLHESRRPWKRYYILFSLVVQRYRIGYNKCKASYSWKAYMKCAASSFLRSMWKSSSMRFPLINRPKNHGSSNNRARAIDTTTAPPFALLLRILRCGIFSCANDSHILVCFNKHIDHSVGTAEQSHVSVSKRKNHAWPIMTQIRWNKK